MTDALILHFVKKILQGILAMMANLAGKILLVTILVNIVHLNSQNIEAWMVKPLSAGCVNTVVAC